MKLRGVLLGIDGIHAARRASARGIVIVLALAACAKAHRDGAGVTGPPSAAPTVAMDASPPAAARPLTYWARVAPILEEKCTVCHAPGGIGPMALTTYADARAHADDVARETAAGEMPPWLPDTRGCAALKDERKLADEDVRALGAWAQAGAPEGDRADYVAPPPRHVPPSVARAPDIVVEPDRPYAPRRGKGKEDDYHCFVLDPKLDAPAQMVGVRVAPGSAAIVHHVILFEVRANAVPAVQKRDDAEPGPGYACFGGIGVNPSFHVAPPESSELLAFDTQLVAAWAPGAGAGGATAFPEGTALALAAGSRLVLQVHYSLRKLTPGMTDRTRVELFLAHTPVPKQAFFFPLLRYDFHVPPGVGPDDPRAEARVHFDAPLPLEIHGVAPHMHLRGKSVRVDLGPPDACLVDIPAWDFHHQEAYWLATPQRARGATLTCRYDNRPEAQPVIDGKRAAPRELHWGEGTDDEMCLAFLYATL